MPVTLLYALIDMRKNEGSLGTPFYIGIGSHKRPHDHVRNARGQGGHRNKILDAVIQAHFAAGIVPAVAVLDEFATRDEALDAEIDMIARLGRRGIEPDGILCNLAVGGKGGMPGSGRGVKKTMTEAAIAARRANLHLAFQKDTAREAMRQASLRSWADPGFRAERSASQAAAWQDPEKRANMLEGRSEGIAQSWQDPEVREKRTTNISAAVATKWEDDPDYAERSRAGLRAAWADPEKKAARVAKMLASRAAKGANRTIEGIARQSAVMTAVNASMSAEDRSIIQAKSWADPAVAAARKAGIQKAAQDPALKAARLAAMAAGKRRKAAERAAQSGGSG